MKRKREIKPDIRMYLQCTKCENIFSVIKSGVQNAWVFDGTNGEMLFWACCPRCGEVRCKVTTRKAFNKSNEVRPDNAK